MSSTETNDSCMTAIVAVTTRPKRPRRPMNPQVKPPFKVNLKHIFFKWSFCTKRQRQRTSVTHGERQHQSIRDKTLPKQLCVAEEPAYHPASEMHLEDRDKTQGPFSLHKLEQGIFRVMGLRRRRPASMSEVATTLRQVRSASSEACPHNVLPHYAKKSARINVPDF